MALPNNHAAMPVDNDNPENGEGQEEEEDFELTWNDIIKHSHVEAQDPTAKALVKLLGCAPPLPQLRASASEVIKYAGVPETPQPRRNRVDQQLFQAQSKLENVLHLLVHYHESGNSATLGATVAFARGAWEDLQQQRRSFYAGRQAWKLEPRADDGRPKLLTQDEEKKLQVDRQPRAPTRFNTSWGNQPAKPFARSRSQSQSHGKGKGKGGKGHRWSQK